MFLKGFNPLKRNDIKGQLAITFNRLVLIAVIAIIAVAVVVVAKALSHVSQ